MDVTVVLRDVEGDIAGDAVKNLLPIVEEMARNGLAVSLEVTESVP